MPKKKKQDNGNFEMIAKTYHGLEDVLAKELLQLGAQNIKTLRRAVKFKGDLGFMYKANLSLRTAVRIIKPIKSFRVRNEDQLYQKGTTNVWSIISADPELNMVYLPTGNTSPDNFGGHRNGSDYYSSSVVSLDADTGEVIWHFQTVHHDVWDYDLPSQPTFYDFEKDGKKIKALAQTTKTGLIFLLNRETGEPIFPIEEKEVPQGTVKGDYLSRTQPFPTKPKGFDFDLEPFHSIVTR